MHSWFERSKFWNDDWLDVAGRRLPLVLAHHPRARRYVLRLRPNGTVRVTIPRGGSAAGARRFAEENLAWLAVQSSKTPAFPPAARAWTSGCEMYFRGETVRLEVAPAGNNLVRFGSETVRVADTAADLRPAVEFHLRRLAERELPPRVQELAARHQLTVQRVTVRNQRSRWGSCSRRGTISLNWRLIQTPSGVRDYIILHELMHLREMNHSARFWQQVEKVCPNYQDAEQWLKQHSRLLRQ